MSRRLRLLTAAKPFVFSLGTVGLGKLLQIGLLVIMARRMDVAAFGALGVLINASQIAAYVHAAGLSNGATRMVAMFDAQRNWGALSGFLAFSLRLLLATTCIFALIGAAVYFAGWLQPFDIWYFVALTIVSGVGIARAGWSLGLHDVLGALLPREVIAPAVSIAAILFFLNLESSQVAWIYLLGFVVAEFAGAYFLVGKIPPEIAATKAQSDAKGWLRILAPMQAIAMMTIALQRVDLIIVGLMFDLHTAALYAAAQRVAQVLNVLARVNAFAVAPQIARAYHSGDGAKVWRTIWFAVALGAAVGVPICLGVAVASEPIMALFGPEYVAATRVLIALSIGQLASAILGPMTQALAMTAHEREQAMVLAILCAIALPGFWVSGVLAGALGVAGFSAMLWALYNGIALLLALNRIGQPLHVEK